MAKFFVDVLLYTGQHLQSEMFPWRRDAQRCQRSLVTCTMIETLCIVSATTGEVIDQMDSLAVRASAWRDNVSE